VRAAHATNFNKVALRNGEVSGCGKHEVRCETTLTQWIAPF